MLNFATDFSWQCDISSFFFKFSLTLDYKVLNVRGYSKFIGNCSVLKVELWGVYEGLKLLAEDGYTKVEVNIYFTLVVKVISKARRHATCFLKLESDTLHWLDKIEIVEVLFAPRETNGCACT